jgi:H+/Cl- antiporter ClcA
MSRRESSEAFWRQHPLLALLFLALWSGLWFFAALTAISNGYIPNHRGPLITRANSPTTFWSLVVLSLFLGSASTVYTLVKVVKYSRNRGHQEKHHDYNSFLR